jgi:hypothetical protein
VVQAYLEQLADVRIELRDRRDVPTEVYDRLRGITWELPDQITIDDPDQNPLDAELTMVGLTSGEPVRVRATLDGDPDELGERLIVVESEDIEILEPPPGQAVAGRLALTLRQV